MSVENCQMNHPTARNAKSTNSSFPIRMFVLYIIIIITILLFYS